MWLHDDFAKYSGDWFVANSRAVVEAILACKKMDTWGLNREELENEVCVRSPESWAEVVDCVYRLFAAITGKPNARWGDKNNFYISYIDSISQLFPNAKFLHIVRDPRYVAASYRRIVLAKNSGAYAPNLPSDASDIADQWMKNISLVRDGFKNLPKGHFAHITYENLTKRTETSLETICSFLDEEYDSDMLRFHEINARDKLEPVQTMGWKAKTLLPVSAEKPMSYLDVVSASEADLIEEKCRVALAAITEQSLQGA